MQPGHFRDTLLKPKSQPEKEQDKSEHKPKPFVKEPEARRQEAKKATEEIVPPLKSEKPSEGAQGGRLGNFMKFMADIEEEMSSRFEQESQASSARRPYKKQIEDVSLVESERPVNIPTRQRQDMREYHDQSPTPLASVRQQKGRYDHQN